MNFQNMHVKCTSLPLYSLFYIFIFLQAQWVYGTSSSNTLQSLAMVVSQKTVAQFMTTFMGQNANSSGISLGSVDVLSAQYLSELNKLGQNGSISEQCMDHVTIFYEAIDKNENWAIKMIDAMGKPPSGLMEGNLLWTGNWDECRSTEAILQDNSSAAPPSNDALFSGKYCTASLPMQIGQGRQATLNLGVCLPSTCSTEDVQTLIKIGEPKVKVECQETESLDDRAIVAIVICSVILVLMLLSTLFDALYINWILDLKQKRSESYFVNGHVDSVKMSCETNGTPHLHTLTGNQPNEDTHKYKPGLAAQVLLSFSLYTNVTKLFNTNQSKSSLTAINGIRFISMTWVVIGHGFGVIMRPVSENTLKYGQDLISRQEVAPILNANFAVDTFYVLSGLLVSYLSLQELKKIGGAKKFHWIMFYFHRFWRLTPPYMLVLMVYVCLYKYTISGPLRYQEKDPDIDCYEGWWRNLLYVNNLVKGKIGQNGCMSWTWYLATDMQMYIVSPLMFVPLYYSRIFSGLSCLGFLLLSMVSSGVTSILGEFPAYNMFDRSKAQDFGWDYYSKPWCRIGPYVCGVVSGYILYKYKDKMKMHWLVVAVGWITSIVVGCLIIYGLFSSDLSNPFSPDVSALFNATARTAWGACICWVILSCATGYGGIINRFLSWSAFVPLGRLTYMAYLVHPIMEKIYIYGQPKPLYLYDYGMVYTMIGHVTTSYGAAFLLSMAFEVPMISLEKVLLRREKKE